MKATEVTAGLAESNGSLLPGLWRDSLHVICGLTACTPGSAPGPLLGNEYGKTLPLHQCCPMWAPGHNAPLIRFFILVLYILFACLYPQLSFFFTFYLLIFTHSSSSFRWYGHVLRKDDDDWVKKCMEHEVEGPRPRGRPKKTWKEVVREDCQARKLNKEDAMDRCKWRKMIKEAR